MHALTFVQVIAVFFFIVAIDFAVRPDDLKGMLRVAIKGSMPHIIGIVRICVGVLFLWVGGSRRMFIGVVGIVVLVAGILSLVVKLDTQKKVATKIINSSEMTRRIMGIAAAIIATLIVLDAWNCLW
jgi:hypothetical protein